MADLPAAVVVGIGELGAVFARGLLKLGHPVYPVTRQQSLADTLRRMTDPALVLICVGEAELAGVLSQLPAAQRDRVALVQNELVPRDWLRAGIERASGVIVWFEKKAHKPLREVLPSAVYGPRTPLLSKVLRSLSLSVREISEAELGHELAFKNLYILVHNLAGLRFKGSVGALWRERPDFARAVAEDVFLHQEALLGMSLDRRRLGERLLEAVAADPEHACAGRTASERLSRVLAQAREIELHLTTLREIADCP